MANSPSELQAFRICGTIQLPCVDDTEYERITVSVFMLRPSTGVLKDPSNGSLVPGANGALIFNDVIDAGNDGCWCTCELLPNRAADPDMALQPNDTSYRIVVTHGSDVVVDQEIVLDADEAVGLPTDTSYCGECINICELVGELPTVPPSNAFCEAVVACLPPETVTPLTLNAGVITYTDETGVTTDIDICDVVNTFCPESLTTIVDNGDGFTYTNENGVPVTVTYPVQPVSVLVDNGDGTYTHDDGSGNTVIIDTTSTPSSLVDNGDGTYTHDDGAGSTVVIDTASSLLVDNGDGTYTHDDGTGNLVTINTGNVVDNGDGTATVTFPDGSTAIVCTDCDHAVTVDNGDGTFSTTNADGTVVTWVGDTDTFATVVDNGDGTLTATNPDGSTVSWAGCCGSLLHTGDTFTLDLTLPDGSTLAAGDPVPEDVLIYASVGETGALVHENSLTLSSGGADPCDAISAMPYGGCAPNAQLVTTSCETIGVDDVATVHAVSCCTGDDISTTVVPGEPLAFDSVSLIDRGWPEILGGNPFNTGLINAEETIPASGLSIDVPGATAGCALVLQVVWSAYDTAINNNSSIGLDIAGAGNGSALSDFALASHEETWVSGGQAGTAQNVYVMNSDGSTGSTVELTFPNAVNPANDTLLDGAIAWHWYEVCGVDATDFGAAVAVPTASGTGAPGAPTPGTGVIESFDPGSCDALFLSFGRHTAIPRDQFGPGTNPDSNWPTDSDWIQADNGSFVELADTTTWDHETGSYYGCQIGLAGGWQPGDSGATGFDYLHTIAIGDPSGIPPRGAAGIWLPLASCTPTPGGGIETFTVCENDLDNPNCVTSGLVRNDVQAKVCVDLPDGAIVEVTPSVNSDVIAASAATFYGPTKACVPISSTYWDPNVVPASGAAVQSLGFVVNVLAPGADPDAVDIQIIAPSICSEMVPV